MRFVTTNLEMIELKEKKKKTTFQKKAKRNVQRKFPEEEVAFKPG